MDLRDYWAQLNQDDREKYAHMAGTTVGHIQKHLIPVPRKVPRRPLMEGLAAATNGAVSMHEVLAHFYDLDNKPPA